ncbi:MAG: DNA-binding protein [Prevotella sp.]|nr:DNA-binding protein [Prevotella sp.]MBR5062505.1 DNA-binding protein [Prevotella sp.]
MTKYIKKEIADLNGKGSTQAYYRIKTFRKLESDEFLESCAKHSGISKGAIVGAIEAISHELASRIAAGYTVKIDGIGTFGGKLGVRKDKELDTFEDGEQKRNAQSLQVTGISFRADRELVRSTDRMCVNLERAGEVRLRKSKFTLEERMALARNFLAENAVMRVGDYVSLTGLSRTTATLELQRLDGMPESGIVSSGRRSSKVYVLA